MTFPDITYGLCPTCGNAVEATSNADAEVRDESVRGRYLTYYPPLDLFMCEICIINYENDEQSIADNEKHVEEETFRKLAGFTTDNSESTTTI